MDSQRWIVILLFVIVGQLASIQARLMFAAPRPVIQIEAKELSPRPSVVSDPLVPVSMLRPYEQW